MSTADAAKRAAQIMRQAEIDLKLAKARLDVARKNFLGLAHIRVDIGGTAVGVKVTPRINTMVNQAAAANLHHACKPGYSPFRIKYELDAKKYESLLEIDPSIERAVEEVITSKPGTPTFKYEEGDK